MTDTAIQNTVIQSFEKYVLNKKLNAFKFLEYLQVYRWFQSFKN